MWIVLHEEALFLSGRNSDDLYEIREMSDFVILGWYNKVVIGQKIC